MRAVTGLRPEPHAAASRGPHRPTPHPRGAHVRAVTGLRPEPHAAASRGPHRPTPHPRGAHVRAVTGLRPEPHAAASRGPHRPTPHPRDGAAPRTPRSRFAGTPPPHAASARRARPEPHAAASRGPHRPTRGCAPNPTQPLRGDPRSPEREPASHRDRGCAGPTRRLAPTSLECPWSFPAQRHVVGVETDQHVQQTGHNRERVAVLERCGHDATLAEPTNFGDQIRQPVPQIRKCLQ